MAWAQAAANLEMSYASPRLIRMFEGGSAPSALDGAARVDAMCAVAREVARQQALLLETMAAVADTSVGVGFDADEVAFALHLPRTVAQREVALARDLVGRLPAVFAALADGRICLARARVFSDVLIPVTDDGLAREIADRLLRGAEECTASQLRSRLLKAVLAADPDAAQRRLSRSIEERRVCLSANDDTTACLSGIYLPPDRAAAAFERMDAIARGLKRDGAGRTLDQLRADVFCDLLAGISPAAGPILRAGVVELLVPLATLTGQCDAPGQMAGYGPVIADIARQVAAAYAGHTAETAVGSGDLAAVADISGDTVAPAAPMQWRYRVHDADGTLLHHGTTRARPDVAPSRPRSGHSDAPRPSDPVRADSSPRPNGPTRSDPPRPHSTPQTARRRLERLLRQQRCRTANPTSPKPTSPKPTAPRPGVGCPPAQDDETARFPKAKLRAWIAARDNTCRAPGCTAPARSADVDHTVDYADGGRTRHDNLGLLCRHHHRLKHEGGFQLRQPQP
jgi:Domain of unknown function (DUF222)/HNH endonuclease